ncbi:hypothetical protein ABT354_10290 [Streptomyces sp. NPDC000594]|uniref:hypothetical protein n=1 Tax=Streptomyces sp. NPDC000594 TaxID=3154261 RepID=UPI0033279057
MPHTTLSTASRTTATPSTTPSHPEPWPGRARTGVRPRGALDSGATTALAGCAALSAGLHPPTGMVTGTPPFATSGLPGLARAHEVGLSSPLPEPGFSFEDPDRGPSGPPEPFHRLPGFAGRPRDPR